MNKVTAALLAGLLASAAAACSPELDRARELEPLGSDFSKALYDGYVRLAVGERDESDFKDADGFALRAAMAAKGELVLPEPVAARKLPPGKVAELAEARRRLMAAFDAGARERRALDAAEAQIGFDCWLQEQEENIQPNEIAACRRGFFGALARLEAAPRPPKLAAMPDPTARTAPGSAAVSDVATVDPAPPAKSAFVVPFDLNSAELTPGAREIIREIVAAAKEEGAVTIIVAGHADRSGSERHNDGLSERRASAVAAALTRGGLTDVIFETRAYGEKFPAVATGDGIEEPRNRRVEVDLGGGADRTASRD